MGLYLLQQISVCAKASQVYDIGKFLKYNYSGSLNQVDNFFPHLITGDGAISTVAGICLCQRTPSI